jgi:A/G-specific adenine glycosylase
VRRDLPWRREPEPYRVWVSEIMLQQTRVEAVIPYYERWLERFPTLAALAAAEPDAVLRAWEGLGYYSRARNLHAAARLVRERHGGRVPDSAAALRGLPGIGAYTAAAIASIAFDRAEAAVDGNIRRVLARLHDLETPTPAEVQRLAAELLPADRPGDHNQALMELGATVCTPRAPACPACPLAARCLARAAGTQEERPRPKPARPLPEHAIATAAVVAPDGAVWLRRRPERGLLAGLWELPGAVIPPGGSAEGTAADLVRLLLGVDASGTLVGQVPHTFTHLRAVYHCVRFDPPAATGGADAVWARPEELDGYALPVAQRKLLGLLASPQISSAPPKPPVGGRRGTRV